MIPKSLSIVLAAAAVLPVAAEDADLAKKLSNPVSDLISVPIQGNLDFGPGDGTKWITNIQPVIPIGLNDEWNVISRTILSEQAGQRQDAGPPGHRRR